jgi:hypothetical protein
MKQKGKLLNFIPDTNIFISEYFASLNQNDPTYISLSLSLLPLHHSETFFECSSLVEGNNLAAARYESFLQALKKSPVLVENSSLLRLNSLSLNSSVNGERTRKFTIQIPDINEIKNLPL